MSSFPNWRYKSITASILVKMSLNASQGIWKMRLLESIHHFEAEPISK
jgi:hypothetical protein